MTMTYDEVLAHLDSLQMHKIKLGLDAMQSFLDKVGRPENDLSMSPERTAKVPFVRRCRRRWGVQDIKLVFIPPRI